MPATLLHGLPDPEQGAAFYRGVPAKRALAWLFDMILIGVVSVLLVPFTAFTAIFYFPVLMLIVGFFYRWFTIASGSATWGMRLMAIELRQSSGERMSNETAFWHTAGYSFCITVAPLQVISALMMLVTARGQGLTDMVLDTAAINKPA